MSKPTVLTNQQILDAGLNVFGLRLFIESIANYKDIKTFEPISFIYMGVELTFKPSKN